MPHKKCIVVVYHTGFFKASNPEFWLFYVMVGTISKEEGYIND